MGHILSPSAERPGAVVDKSRHVATETQVALRRIAPNPVDLIRVATGVLIETAAPGETDSRRGRVLQDPTRPASLAPLPEHRLAAL